MTHWWPLHVPWNVFDMLWFLEGDPSYLEPPPKRKSGSRRQERRKRRMTRKRWEIKEAIADRWAVMLSVLFMLRGHVDDAEYGHLMEPHRNGRKPVIVWKRRYTWELILPTLLLKSLAALTEVSKDTVPGYAVRLTTAGKTHDHENE